MSSRFFHGGDSDSESSSSDEEELYSDRAEESEESSEEEDEEEEESEDGSSEDEGRGTGASRFLKPSGGGADDSDESEDEDRERVVKSAKDKRFEELEGTIKLIENAQKINDWAVISTGACLYSCSTAQLTCVNRVRQNESAGSQSPPAERCSQNLHQDDRRP